MLDVERKIIEECSELIQAICKADEYGYDNYDPDITESTLIYTNKYQISLEILDVEKAIFEYKKFIRERG